MKEELVLYPPAKINLFFRAIAIQDDGYVEVFTGLQAVSLYDTLQIGLMEKSEIRLTCKGFPVPSDRDNLVWKAAELFRSYFSIDYGITIKLTKKIPPGGGLGGGSADAAFTLKGLAMLTNVGEISELMKLAATLGSDVPFFLSSGSAIARGRGDVIKEVDFPLDYHILLVYPGFPVLTNNAYKLLKKGLTKSVVQIKFLSRAEMRSIEKLLSLGNDFEMVIFREQTAAYKRIREPLTESGSVNVRLTGSGSVIYGVYRTEEEAQKVKELFKGYSGYKTWVVNPIRLPIRFGGRN